jgi:hypothetical protein
MTISAGRVVAPIEDWWIVVQVGLRISALDTPARGKGTSDDVPA